MTTRHFTKARDVVDWLGGIEAVCEMTGRDLKTVYHWIGRSGTFPARYHDMMTKALKKRGCTAPPALWNQEEEQVA
jgi:hypothetical protein